jgi:hypothetical protein
MARSLKGILGDGYDPHASFRRNVWVDPKRAKVLMSEQSYKDLYEAKPAAPKPQKPSKPTLKVADQTQQIPGDISAANERISDFVQRAMTAKNFFLETLCAAVVYGMGIPKESCSIIQKPHYASPGLRREDLSWIEPKNRSVDFRQYERFWTDCPPSGSTVTACNAAMVTHEWRLLMNHQDRLETQSDHVLLVLAFHRVLNCLPTQVELVTETEADGMRVRWRYRRRDAGTR